MITAMLRSTMTKSCNYSPLKVNIVIEVVNYTVGVAVSNTGEISGLIGSSIISSIPYHLILWIIIVRLSDTLVWDYEIFVKDKN